MRKSPVRHKVKAHKRNGKNVRSFTRGKGEKKKTSITFRKKISRIPVKEKFKVPLRTVSRTRSIRKKTSVKVRDENIKKRHDVGKWEFHRGGEYWQHIRTGAILTSRRLRDGTWQAYYSKQIPDYDVDYNLKKFKTEEQAMDFLEKYAKTHRDGKEPAGFI